MEPAHHQVMCRPGLAALPHGTFHANNRMTEPSAHARLQQRVHQPRKIFRVRTERMRFRQALRLVLGQFHRDLAVNCLLNLLSR